MRILTLLLLIISSAYNFMFRSDGVRIRLYSLPYKYLFLLMAISSTTMAQSSYKNTLERLDQKITEKDKYYNNREQRINSLHNLLVDTKNINNVFTIYKALNKEYIPYNIDSALYYSTKCLKVAGSLKDKSSIVEAKLLQAKSLVLLGLYEESKEILSTINPNKITKTELIDYYIVQISLNRFKSVYLPKTNFLPNYDSIRASYQDKLLKIINKDSPKYMVTLADRKKDEGKYLLMKDIMIESLNKLDITNRAYGYTAYTLAEAYGLLGDEDSKIKYLALSSISDIVGGVRENAALRELALLLLNKGDIAHSNKYIQLAFDDAVFSNAKLRSYEVLQILPLINDRYEQMRNRMSKNKTIFGIILGLLALILIIAFYYILRQKIKLQDALEKNRIANDRLFELNNTLEENNKKVLSYNHSLELLNKGKEEYIAHYLKLSSSYIRKIDDFRKMLYKKAQKDNKEDILKTLRSNEFVNNELKLFYQDFDKSFIELYPNFVNEFNLLLKDEEKITLKSNEILNTELRIFALIRLGITDSTQIARFLRYSVTTIYNYRTKTRNSSRYSKSEFLSKVESIGN